MKVVTGVRVVVIVFFVLFVVLIGTIDTSVCLFLFCGRVWSERFWKST